MSEKKQQSGERNTTITQHGFSQETLQEFLYGKKKTTIVDIYIMERRKRKLADVKNDIPDKLKYSGCGSMPGEGQKHSFVPQPKVTYAVGSFPPEVRLCTSSIPEYDYGACAARYMPRGTWIGPYEGKRVYSTQLAQDQENSFIWEIYENGKFSHFLDGSDENNSSWMRFIRCARHKQEQNMSAIQYGKNIYYHTIKDINEGEEMLVWYHESYNQFWGIPIALQQETNERNGPPIPIHMIPPVNMSTNQSKSNLSGDNESRKLQKYEQTIKNKCSLSSPHYGFYIQAQRNLPNFQHSINSLQQSETAKGCVPNSYMVPSKNPQHQNTMPLHYNQLGTSQYLYPHYHKYHNKSTGIQPHQSTTIEGRQYAMFLQTPSKLDRHASVPINLVSPVQKSFASLAILETSGDPNDPNVPTSIDQQTPLREQPEYLKPQAFTNREVKENMPLKGERHDEINDHYYKNNKNQSKTTPFKNLTPSIHNQQKQDQPLSTIQPAREQDVAWTCGQCGEMFAQQVSLRMHVCSKASSKPFHCGHCSSAFSTSSELREHVVSHSNERPFKCGFCGRSFAGATTLGNHMRTHTGQRPYECKICGQTFAIATQLNRHLKPPGECGFKQKHTNKCNENNCISAEQ